MGSRRSYEGKWEVPTTWQKVQEVSKFLKGKKIDGMDAHGYLDPLKGVGVVLVSISLGSRATAYAKHPNDPAFLFDPDTMKPRVNNPAWVKSNPRCSWILWILNLQIKLMLIQEQLASNNS